MATENEEKKRTEPAGVDRHSALPIYYQLFSTLRDDIFNGRFDGGEMLPGEFELCRTYGVSRATVRRALEELANRGLIVRQPGQGTRVRRRPSFSPLTARIDGLAERAYIIGHSTEAEVLEFEELPPPPEVAAILQLEDEPACMSAVVRRLDGAPFVHFTSWVPASVAQSFTRAELARRPALSLLENSGLIIDHVEQTIGAEPATRWVATHLQVEPGSPLLRVERVVFAQSGMPIEWSVALFPHDRHQYRIDLQAR